MIKLSKYKGKYNNKVKYYFISDKTDIFGHGFNLKETIELFTNKKICRRDDDAVRAIEKYLELVIEKEYNSIEELKLDYIEELI